MHGSRGIILVITLYLSLADACQWFTVVWESWSDCSESCAGGTRRRHGKSCFWKIPHDETESCNEFCYNTGSYYSGYCHCQPWRNGRCCEYCNYNHYIANCIGIKECGGSPDNIRCTQCASPYYPGGYGSGCLDSCWHYQQR